MSKTPVISALVVGFLVMAGCTRTTTPSIPEGRDPVVTQPATGSGLPLPVPLWSSSGTYLGASQDAIYAQTQDGMMQVLPIDCEVVGGSCQPIWQGPIGLYGPEGTTRSVVAGDMAYVLTRYVSGQPSKSVLSAFPQTCTTDPCGPSWTWTSEDFAQAKGIGLAANKDGVYVLGDDHRSKERLLYAFPRMCSSRCQPVWSATVPRPPQIPIGTVTAVPGHSERAVVLTQGSTVLVVTDGATHAPKVLAFASDCGSHGQECTPLWTSSAPPYLDQAAPVIQHGTLVVPSDRLYAYPVGCHPSGGVCEPSWTATIPSGPFPIVIGGEGRIFVSGGGGEQGRMFTFALDDCGKGGSGCRPTWTARSVFPIVVSKDLLIGGSKPPPETTNGSYRAFSLDCGHGGVQCQPRWVAPFKGDPYEQSHSTHQAVASGLAYVSGQPFVTPTESAAESVLLAYPLACHTPCAPVWLYPDYASVYAATAKTVILGTGGRIKAFAAPQPSIASPSPSG